MILDHDKKPVNDFWGIWRRDSFYDSTPADHFIDTLNTIKNGQEVKTRDGFEQTITFSNIRRIRLYKREGEATRILVLNDSGDLYDLTASPSTPIIELSVQFSDFSIVSEFNRCYITPHNGTKGISDGFVYVYQGTGLARKAAGLAPVSTFSGVVSAVTGIIETGTHLFAWVYETDSGFVTRPGNIVALEFDGTKAVSFSSIPTGPAGTVARRLIASKAIQNYNGDTEGYEMFFVSGARIDDNSTTVLNDVSFFDSELQLSADYTFDQLEEIPAGVFIVPYGKKICIGGEDQNPSMVRVSKDGEPESFNELNGFIICDPHETEGVKNAVEFRDNLYITKGNPGHTYTVRDNGFEASTWKPVTIDKGIGADCHGISLYLDTQGANADFFLVADVAGIFKFDGSYNTELPLTYKIQEWWNRINKSFMENVEVTIDSKKFLIYIVVPLDSSEFPNTIFVGSYKEGLSYDKISWHIWTSSVVQSPVSIAVDISELTGKSVLMVANRNNIYTQIENMREDEGFAINSYIQFALLYKTPNYIHHFVAIGLRVKGSGVLASSAWTEDLAVSQNLLNHTLTAAPGREYLVPMNFTNEKCSIRLGTNAIGAYFELREMILYLKEVWATRPA